ncbi:hypothetical protein GDO81_021735 [Engystomops pustulosus]|uniref:Uncharacterized protein n=1 Tax=Engystomops pustulosus TaxID=76066 RepID=A0AAV6ZBV5_ENGPU|nr:hypothetical protein GDO81_021735 [Engystomops pustulosus]
MRFLGQVCKHFAHGVIYCYLQTSAGDLSYSIGGLGVSALPAPYCLNDGKKDIETNTPVIHPDYMDYVQGGAPGRQKLIPSNSKA